MSETKTEKSTSKVKPDLKDRIAAVRQRCVAVRSRKPATKDGSAVWPNDLNAPARDKCWGGDPVEVHDE